MQYTRVMMRPRPIRRAEPVKIEAVEPIAKIDYKRCKGCVSRKMCDDAVACLHGSKAKKGKKRNGRVSAK
jgi:hypothetical protein